MSNVKTYAEVPHIQYCSFAIHPFDCGSLVMSGPSADFCGSSRRVENQFDGYRFSNWGASGNWYWGDGIFAVDRVDVFCPETDIVEPLLSSIAVNVYVAGVNVNVAGGRLNVPAVFGSSGTLLVLGSERSCNDNVSIEVAVCAGDPAVAAKVAHGLEKKYGRQWFLLFVNLLGRLKKHDIWY